MSFKSHFLLVADLGFLFLCFGTASLGQAGPIAYHVSVNTSLTTGTSGYLDFQFCSFHDFPS
jgi:hypothetical protein